MWRYWDWGLWEEETLGGGGIGILQHYIIKKSHHPLVIYAVNGEALDFLQ